MLLPKKYIVFIKINFKKSIKKYINYVFFIIKDDLIAVQPNIGITQSRHAMVDIHDSYKFPLKDLYLSRIRTAYTINSIFTIVFILILKSRLESRYILSNIKCILFLKNFLYVMLLEC